MRAAVIMIGMQAPADGNYVVVRHDSAPVIKVIDVSGDVPVVISFAVAPGGASSGFAVPQVLVDADSMTAVAVTELA